MAAKVTRKKAAARQRAPAADTLTYHQRQIRLDAARDALELRRSLSSFVRTTVVDAKQRSERRRQLFSATSDFRAGERSGFRSDWQPRAKHPDEEGHESRDLIVQRSMDMDRNNPYAHALLESYTQHVVGTGPWTIRSDSRPEWLASAGLTRSQVMEWREAADAVFDEACECIDSTRSMDIWEALRVLFKASLHGDSFARIFRGADTGDERMVSLLIREGLLCRTPQKRMHSDRIRYGVRFDASGAPDAYYLHDDYESPARWQSHQKKKGKGYKLVNRYDEAGRLQVAHLMRVTRPGQSRGWPWLTTVMTSLDDAASYDEAELMAARMNACIGLIRNRTNMTPSEMTRPGDGHREEDDIDWFPGMVIDSPDGHELTPFTPNRPNSTFGPFIDHVLTVICASQGYSAMVAMRDWRGANYSVSKATINDALRTFRQEQRWLVSRLLRPLREAVIEQAWMDGLLPPLPLYDGRTGRVSAVTRELMRASFDPPTHGWVDPTKDVQAAALEVKHRLNSRRNIMTSLGRNWRNVFDDLAEEDQLLRDMGIPEDAESAAIPNTPDELPVPSGEEAPIEDEVLQ